MPDLIPRMPAPELSVETIAHERWKLADRRPEAFTLIVFYRGLHCPVCKTYLHELDRRLGEFGSRGVEVIAISGDDEERARRSQADWELGELRVGYGLTLPEMRRWGLFVSRAIKEGEPELFNEPGLFLIAPDGTVFYEALNSMPFARPRLADVLAAIDFVAEKHYPARGEVGPEVTAAP
ncbi:MAG: peroxiredoxin-like family protein [Candidatus Dormibacteria bacterium]